MAAEASGNSEFHAGEGQTEPACAEREGHSIFPIAAIGASAGGLEAYQQLLRGLPENTGMAFLLAQHLAPRSESRLPDLLGRATSMPVMEAAEGMTVAPNHVYVIPPNADMAVAGGLLRITPRPEGRGPHLPIDLLFRSLAEEQQGRAIGVVLSGTGSDGTLGLGEIKAVGGITFAQDELSAKHSGMPRSAVESGSVDFILTAEEIGRLLGEIGAHPYLRPNAAGELAEEETVAEDSYDRVLAAVRGATGVDFSQYRDTTIKRRIMRRMALHTERSMADYADRLENNRTEAEALYRDLLINVTSFFRDPKVFEALKEKVFPQLVRDRPSLAPFRVWVPGCSTGQEAYSIAMAIIEFFDEMRVRYPIQIFATDLSDQETLDRARAGVYPEGIEREVGDERLRRFFKKEDHSYRIDKSIRDMCVFARHNLAADPPFSRLDLISCRNVLIYLSPQLQKRVVPTLHYALNVPGFLVLGPAESAGDDGDLFDPVDRDFRIYAKKPAAGRSARILPRDYKLQTARGLAAKPSGAPPVDFQKEADRLLLGRYSPAGVLVDQAFNVIQFRGRTGAFLETPPGEPTMNLFRLAREGLFLELRSACAEANQTNAPVIREDVRIQDGENSKSIDLEVVPIKSPAGGECLLILFHERGQPGAEPLAPPSAPVVKERADAETSRLRQELSVTKEYLQSLVEQQNATNEELRSANEEILSSNEELQSTNEELETAKEELQSTNEELATVNEQLANRNFELAASNNDWANLVASASIPIVIVGNDLNIRRFTPAAPRVMNLLPTDIGRPINDIQAAVQVPDLPSLIASVIESVESVEREVRDREGRWFLLRINPYRTSEDKIEGALVIFVDIDQVKQARAENRESSDYSHAVVDTIRQPLLVLDGGLRVVSANRSYYESYRTSPRDTEKRLFRELGDGLWNLPGLEAKLRGVLKSDSGFVGHEIEINFPRIGNRAIKLDSRRIDRQGGRSNLVLLVFDDVTEERRSHQQFLEADRIKNEFLATLAHELRNPLAPIRHAIELLKAKGPAAPETADALDMIARQSSQLVRLVDDILDVTRVTRNLIKLQLEQLDLLECLEAASEAARPLFAARGETLEMALPKPPVMVNGDRVRLTQMFTNLFNNAAKYSEPGGKTTVKIETAKDAVSVSVKDNGVGIAPELIPKIFDLFFQADGMLDGSRGGLGVGLSITKQLVEMHGGTIEARSEGLGQGSEFVVRLPTVVQSGDAPRPSEEPPEAKPRSRRILVVDDNRDAGSMLRMLLQSMGQDVQIALDGEAAIKRAEEMKPDIILLDIGLPRMSGHEVCRRIRQSPWGTGIVIAAVTGWGQDEDRQKSKEAGFDLHFTKPINSADLKKLIAGPNQIPPA